VETNSLPKNLSPQQRQQFNAGMEMIKKMKITIILKGDHTYTATATGNPNMKQQTDSGTWKQAGNQVIISPKRKNSPKSETLTLSADGKTMSMAFPAGAMKGKVLFTR
jgi:hypothetical protein